MPELRAISNIFAAIEQAEGAGARVRRSIGSRRMRNFSPFLMLDHMNENNGAGFPDHPHRGQETVTYILKGSAEHEDFLGNKGILHAGDLQFMTAGRGIMHSEQPLADSDGSPGAGFQLWVDLPKHLKMCEPRYRDLRAQEIPIAHLDNGKVLVKVISGRSGDVDSFKDLAYTPVWYLDVEIQPGGKLVQPVPKGWNAFSYVFEGHADFVTQNDVSTRAGQYDAVIFKPGGDAVSVQVPENAQGSARLLLVAGQILDQPIVQHGPFVLTSTEEAQQAFEDFYSSKNGFERAKGWQSENMRRRMSI
ncbi:RmlC-like cupin domain-containing protein [Dactylonectria estremocensis]|uniref:RmlC-like cupin domain-containing protein n=1 Tax=Dactylonectria estremocensis TaxID=1079267 RepID=A0A9P9ESS2_9HYPO|nr:RmlC-like cupin domain-containing protein [Dactylonectria estremocensis]